MKTIEEKNRMIAEFMGYKIDIESINICELSESQIAFAFDYLMKPFQREKYMLGGNIFEIENVYELKYHTSWDWLMPVVEKIELIGYSVEKNFQRIDGDFQCLITKGNDILFQEFAVKSIEAMHYVVVEFIEWFAKYFVL